MKPPAFQFYADDFLAGTFSMTNDERGLYITLLCIQWGSGFISDDDFNRLGNAMALPSLSRVKAKFDRDPVEGVYRNSRLEGERRKQADYRRKQSENASKRWVGNAAAMPPHIPNACSPSPSPSPVLNTIAPEPKFDAEEVAGEAGDGGSKGNRDHCWETLAALHGWKIGNPMSQGEGGRVGKALSDIRAASPGVTAEEIARRIANYRARYPDAAVTATAISNNWALCNVSPLKKQRTLL